MKNSSENTQKDWVCMFLGFSEIPEAGSTGNDILREGVEVGVIPYKS